MTAPVVCFYTGTDRPYKRGTILRNVMESFQARGLTCTHEDASIEPDVYVFEKFWHETRYRKPVIVHAENLIGEETLTQHVHDRGDAIVFNSEWLRWTYFNTFGSELERAYVIAPAHRANGKLERTAPHPAVEQHVTCVSKWWKRPYKRFPLMAESFDRLYRSGFPNAHLHVLGWLTGQPMPYLDTRPHLWKLSRSVKSNPNIHYYEKGFHDETFDEVLARTHVLLHLSVIDSGPQVVMEALSQGIPVVISNNMGAAEWVRRIGPASGRVLDVDPITLSHAKINALPLMSRRLCSSTDAADAAAAALRSILADYEAHSFEPPRDVTVDGITERWLAVVHDVLG